MKNDLAIKEIIVGVRLGIDDCVAIDLRTQKEIALQLILQLSKSLKTGSKNYLLELRKVHR